RVDAAGGDHDDFAVDALLLAGDAIEILDAAGEAAIVDEDAGGDGVRADLELLGFEGERQQVIRGAEERSRIAAAAALAAVVAGRESAYGARHVGAAAVDDRHAELGAGAHHDAFGAARRWRWQEFRTAGQRVGIVRAAVDADQLIDLVVVRRDVLVG